MIFFLDENFPKKAAAFLEKKGHTVIDIRGTDLEGIEDTEIFALSKDKSAVFLTCDKDFYHTIHLNEKPHPGIIVIALRQPNSISILEKLVWILDNIDRFSFENKCILCTDTKCTIFS